MPRSNRRQLKQRLGFSAKNISIAEARERTVQLLTDQWQRNLIDLAEKLMAQGFSQEETIALCEDFRPMFEANLTEALVQFDRQTDILVALHRANSIAGAFKPEGGNA